MMFDENYYKELREDIRRAIALAEKQNENIVDAVLPLKTANIKNAEYYYNRHKEQLCSPQFEGNTSYVYLDSATNQHPTVGCGLNIDVIPNIRLINRQTGENLSTLEQNRELERLRQEHRGNYKASYYEDKSFLGILPEEAQRQQMAKYNENFNYLSSNLPNWEDFSDAQKDALLDIAYNRGARGAYNYIKNRVPTQNITTESLSKIADQLRETTDRQRWIIDNLRKID